MAARPLLTLLIPTRNRAEELLNCINGAISNAKGWPLHLVIGFDDDAESYIKHSTADKGKLPAGVDVTCLYLKPRHYYVRAVNELYRFASRHVDFDYFFLSNDDVAFAPNWAAQAVRGLQRSFPNGEGICELAGPELCAHYVSRKAFIDTHFARLLAEPCYTFYFSDREMMMRAKLLGRYRHLPGNLVTHFEREDSTRSEVERWFYVDEEQYFRRRVAHKQWPCSAVPRKVFVEVFKGAPEPAS